ncbi:MAG: ABC transporter permease [Clostridia bacterium]|nr:ABC transporter permease [Clostridia bacterium]
MKYFQTFLRYRYLLFNLINRDIKVKYRRSILGILWSVLNPLLMMAVISTVFSTLFGMGGKFGGLSVPFHIYYLTGATIFNFVSEATSTSMMSVFSASQLIKKVYIPKYIFPLEKCMFAFVNMLFSLIAVFIVMVVSRVEFHATIVLIFIPIIYALIFSIGMSLLLSALTVFFRDILHIYSVFLTAWMYATPIIYPLGILNDHPKLMFIMKLNPMYYFVEYFRSVVVYGTIPGIRDNVVCLACSIVMLIIGIAVFKAKQDKFVLYM